jgi:hypothetical protein
MTTKITETVVQKEKTEEQEQDEKFLENLNTFFDGIATDCVCEVYRDQPKALESFLESIPITQDERPIDLEYLAKTWGGRVLRLMVRNSSGKFIKRLYVPLKSYPPKMWGEEISDNPNVPNRKPSEIQPVVEPKDPLEQYLKLSEVMRAQSEIAKQNQPDVANILLSILTPLLQQRLEPPKSSTENSLSEVMKSMKMMRDFMTPKEDQIQQQSGGNPEDMIIPAILNLSEKILSKPAEPQPRQLQARPQPVQQHMTPQQPQPVPINTKQQETLINPVTISKFMEQLDGDQASVMVIEAMKKMKPEEGERMIQNLMAAFGFEEAEDDEGSSQTVPKPVGHNERDVG